ncbi:MAG: hypothetical protein O7C98_00725 [Planctomycetota bacterium]|nr:hypothetical protein [Planctomycetota bacterium]
MPNTLAHIGAQRLLTHAVIPTADLRWVLIGCVLPDVPWIGYRVVRIFAGVDGLDPYAVRAYFIAQASLFLLLCLCGAAALLSTRPRRVFAVLSLGALLHLLLDAMQTKWGNGVHLFAPFAWSDLNFRWFWPERWPSIALTLLGVALGVAAFFQAPRSALFAPRSRRAVAAGALLFVWLAVPWSLIGPVQAGDAHFVRTLKQRSERPGRYFELDRAHYGDSDGLRTWAPEGLRVVGAQQLDRGVYSVRARFVTESSVEILAFHRHGRFRNLSSVVGLALVAVVCLASLRGGAPRGASGTPPPPPTEAGPAS